jgi:uncharacterized repeat protein (TIGR02543 family)
MARVSIFLIIVALIGGTIGCAPTPTSQYNITIANTEGGSVTTPGQGTASFAYDEGEVVNLVAEPDEGYCFVNWTGDVDTMGNVNDATTTITMNDNYSITANFQKKEPVIFVDPNLEARIREVTNIPERLIYPSDLKGFTAFSAIGRNITNLTGLEHCTSLIVLSINGNRISDISPLANLTGLTALSVDGNRISDISPLANLTNLTQLSLSGNQISDISSLVNLTNLNWLQLSFNEIGDICLLVNLTSLEVLDFCGNQISDISLLANLTGLTSLSLSGNQISDISPLANLTGLTNLSLWGNQISDISPVANLTNLIQLSFTGNQISDISPLANLTNLTWLWLWGNHISDISPLVDNPGLSEGDYIDLRANPLSAASRNTYIPQLQAKGVTVEY